MFIKPESKHDLVNAVRIIEEAVKLSDKFLDDRLIKEIKDVKN